MNHQKIKFLLALGDRQLEEIISYNKLSNLVTESMAAKESGQSEFSSYSGITDHQGPLKAHDPKYHGSSYNVLVAWDDGMQLWEPLNMMAKQDPVTLARYAHDHDLPTNLDGSSFGRPQNVIDLECHCECTQKERDDQQSLIQVWCTYPMHI